MMRAFRLLRSFYQFVKEVILGKATLAQAYRYDPRRVYVLAIVMLSLTLNVTTIPLLYRSLERILELRGRIVELHLQLDHTRMTLEQGQSLK